MDKVDTVLLPLSEAARFLGVSRSALLRLETEGRITPSRTPGGHRRYDSAALAALCGHLAPAPTMPAHHAGAEDSSALVSRIGAQLLTERDLDVMLVRAAEAARKVTGATVSAFFALGAEGSLLGCHPEGSWGERLRSYVAAVLPDASSLSNHVQIHDVRGDARFNKHHGMPGEPRSLLAAAVCRRGLDQSDRCGILVAGHESPGFFSACDRERLVALAVQVGMALENVRLYTQMSRRNRMLMVLNQVAATLVVEPDREKALRRVLDVCLQVTGAAYGALECRIRQGERLLLFTGTERNWLEDLESLPLIQATLQGKQTVVGDVRLRPEGDTLPASTPRSLLCVPLRSEAERFTGGIFLAHPHTYCFDDAHIEMTRALAAQAIVAIERMLAAEENAETRRELESIFHGIADPLTVVDHDLRIVDCNDGLLQRLGKRRGEVVGRSYFEVLVGNAREEMWNVAPLVFESGEPQTARVPMVNAEGASLLMDVSAYPVRDSRGNVVKVVEYAKEVTAEVRLQLTLLDRNEELKDATESLARQAAELDILNRQLQEKCLELERIAVTDIMTGLPNHRAFQQCLMEEIRRAQREHYSLSLLVLDVDRFKDYNDTYGHPAGDEVLRDVGQVLLATLRNADIAARYGGEEFTVVLPHTGKWEACLIAERIRTAIAAHRFPKRAVTVSLGVASYPEDASDKDSLIYMADQALYAAKQAGRNATCSWPVPLVLDAAA